MNAPRSPCARLEPGVGAGSRLLDTGGGCRAASLFVGVFSVVFATAAMGVDSARQGTIAYEIRDARSGEAMPGKLTILGAGKTPTPLFTSSDIGRQVGGAVAAYNRVMSLSGTGTVSLPRGTYDVYVSRGPEWDLFVARGVRVGRRTARIRARLRHVIDSRGWLSADFHVHSAASFDSRVPMADRVFEFASDGVEMIVSTDHNVIADYRPLIRQLGAGRYLASATGEEITTRDWGHFGAFPLRQDTDEAGNGAVRVEGRRPAEIFREVRATAPDAVINVHHPRIDYLIGYFNLARFDARKLRASRPGFSLDFDAVEVLNGFQDDQRRSVERVIADWFALLDHGRIATATGNSDTHHLYYNLGGYPRNYLRVPDDRPQATAPADITRALMAHRAFFTTAPFLRLSVGSAGIGDLVTVRSGRARAEIEVQAAPWVSVNRVTLYQDGRVEKVWAVPRGGAPIRFRASHDVGVGRDGYLVARVDGDEPLTPVVGDLGRFRVFPFALTNPVFLDADGDGRYTRP